MNSTIGSVGQQFMWRVYLIPLHYEYVLVQQLAGLTKMNSRSTQAANLKTHKTQHLRSSGSPTLPVALAFPSLTPTGVYQYRVVYMTVRLRTAWATGAKSTTSGTTSIVRDECARFVK